MTGFRPECQVKQYVAVVDGTFGPLMVFETGDSRFYLFAALDRQGCLTTLSWPVRKSDLRPDVRHALAHGVGLRRVPT